MIRFVLALVFVLTQTPTLLADVLVYDSVAVSGTPVMLKARTGGRFLVRGGELVDFTVEGEGIGRTLSGGDGIAYLEYKPARPGLLKVKASSGGDESTGALLVFGEEDQVVVVEVAGALATGTFLPDERPGSAEAMKKLLERYRVVYISAGLLGVEGDRAWLKEKGFPGSVVLEWKGGQTLQKIVSLGVKVRAAVGGAGFIKAAGQSEDILLLSFDPESKGRRVHSWDEIRKELLP